MTIEPTERLAQLEQLVRDCQGDVPDAIRGLAGCTSGELAERLGLSRQSLEQCLRAKPGRRYPHVRIALEAELGLPAGSMDKVLQQ